jgi:hypothetical protein
MEITTKQKHNHNNEPTIKQQQHDGVIRIVATIVT